MQEKKDFQSSKKAKVSIDEKKFPLCTLCWEEFLWRLHELKLVFHANLVLLVDDFFIFSQRGCEKKEVK